MASPKNEGFLTDEQIEVPETAVQNAEVLSSSPSPSSPTSSLLLQEFYKNHGGGSGAGGGGKALGAGPSYSRKFQFVKVKKDGGGGKDTWGKLIDTDLDPCLNDPNYDSGEEPYELVGVTICDPSDDYKELVLNIIEKYFANGSIDAAISDLKELGFKEYHNYFVKCLISVSMDRQDKEKKMALELLSSLYSIVFSPAHISQGFMMLLKSIDDLAVNIPEAPKMLAVFISQAVGDATLHPAFIGRAKELLPETSKGIEVIKIAEKSYLSAPYHAEQLERRWGGTIWLTVEEDKKKLIDLLREYAENGDTAEAFRCIRKLGVPHLEVVKRAITLAMEKPDLEANVLRLLKEANEKVLISSSQVFKGFSRVQESLDDLSLDIPSAKAIFNSLTQKAVSGKWLDASFTSSAGAIGEVSDDGYAKFRRYMRKIVTIIHEYFLSDNKPKLIRSVEELACPEYNPIFIKKLITLAMEQTNREKEMASALLVALSMVIFTTHDIVRGFTMLLKSAEDTALDVFHASDDLSLFLASAVIDDVLNLEEISNKLPPKSSGTEIISMARTITMARTRASAGPAGQRLLRIMDSTEPRTIQKPRDHHLKSREKLKAVGDNLKVAEGRSSGWTDTAKNIIKRHQAQLDDLRCHENICATLHIVENLESVLDGINYATPIIMEGPQHGNLNKFLDALEKVGRCQEYLKNHENHVPKGSNVVDRAKSLLDIARISLTDLPSAMKSKEYDCCLFNELDGTLITLQKSEVGSRLVGREWIQKEEMALRETLQQYVDTRLDMVLEPISENLESASEDLISERLTAFYKVLEEVCRKLSQIKVRNLLFRFELKKIVKRAILNAYGSFLDEFSQSVEKAKSNCTVYAKEDIGEFLDTCFEGIELDQHSSRLVKGSSEENVSEGNNRTLSQHVVMQSRFPSSRWKPWMKLSGFSFGCRGLDGHDPRG